MRPFNFHPGPKLVSGEGSAASLAEHLPPGRCLFVTDRDVVAFGLTDACRAALEADGREVLLFDAVEADPSLDTLLAAVPPVPSTKPRPPSKAPSSGPRSGSGPHSRNSSSAPSSAAIVRPEIGDGSARMWVLLWVLAGIASIGIGVYFALR